MDKIFRTRIGRVTMKDGTDLTILRTPLSTPAMEHAKAWFRGMAEDQFLPEAMILVAFRANPEAPGWPLSCTAWTFSAEFPARILPDLAAATIKAHMESDITVDEVMSNLGYTRETDPDGAA